MNKYKFEQAAETMTLKIHIYEDIKGDTIDWWTGKKEESKTSANFFKEKLEEYPNIENIDLYINSWGGSVYEAYSICAQLQRHPAYKTSYIDGFAASAASLIPMVCQKVIMPSNAMMMIHRIGSYCYGNSDELRKEADTLDTMMEGNIKLYMNRCLIPEEELKNMIDDETWLTAEKCKELGFCDEIIGEINIEDAQELLQKHTQSLNSIFAQRKALLESFQQINLEKTPLQKQLNKEIEESKENKSTLFLQAFIKQIGGK